MPNPSIGIVIPVFGHPRLVAEAIGTAAAQRFDGTITMVVVIDGDPDPQVVDVVNSMRRETQFYALFRKNGRLPAARNRGIDFLLQVAPDLDAIYFLDADNRLSPEAMGRFWSELAAHPEAGWAYPDIGFFGLTWSQIGVDPRQTAPRYSALRHLMGNICEAGSMVRGDLFRAGLRFDETFTVGYEDWDFWLQCLAAGHRGTPVVNSGFHYRRRSDSMLAEADRRSDEIKAKLRAKHTGLFNPDYVCSRFVDECRPLLQLGADGEVQLLAADGTARGGGAAFDALIEDARTWFYFAYLPRYLVVPVSGSAGEPHFTIAATLALLAAELPCGTMIDRDARAVPADDPGACAHLLSIGDLMRGEFGALTPTPELRGLAARLAALSQPSDQRTERYAGPAHFQIDRFVQSFLGGAPLGSASPPGVREAVPGPAVEAIDPLGRWDSNWLTRGRAPPALLAVRPLPEADMPRIMYLGQTLPYEPPADKFSVAARTLVILEEWRLLPFFRLLFASTNESIYYVCSEAPEAAELTAIQCSEHLLSGIFCDPAHRPLLEGLAVPARKLVTADAFDSVVH